MSNEASSENGKMHFLKKILSIILIPFKLGFEGDKLHHQNRITLIYNCLAYVGIIIITSHFNALRTSGETGWYQYLMLADGYFFASAMLLSNYLHKHKLARIFGILGTNSIAFRAFLLAGRATNGQYVGFVAIVLSVISFNKESKWARWVTLSLSLIVLPLGDYLTHIGFFPLFDLDWPFGIRLGDALLLPPAVAIGVYLEKRLSEEYGAQLEDLNQSLEKKVEERTSQLFQAKQEVEQSSILKSQFMANTSHELRTPVQGIEGYTSMLERRLQNLKPENIDDSKEKMLKSVKLIHTSNERLSDLISKLLDITKMKSGDVAIHASQFSIIESIDVLIKTEDQAAIEKQLTINTENQLTDSTCNQDKTLLELVLTNLISNAIKYSNPSSTIAILLRIQDDQMRISITNVGPGIPEEETKKIFEPFTQGSLTDQTVGGTGLGLAFCKKYSQALGGDVVLEDNSPENTTFTLMIPFR